MPLTKKIKSLGRPLCLHMLQKFHIVNVKIQQLAIVNKYLLKWRQIYNLLTNISIVVCNQLYYN